MLACNCLYLGAFPHNENIDTGISLPNATYSIHIKSVTEQVFDIEVTTGFLIIDKSRVNENMVHVFELKDNTGAIVSVGSDNCFWFETFVNNAKLDCECE